ncbi:MAG: energy transducer TonB [Arenimonas sp.]|nr:energy transducer TonB [Arenimonas sp.]
MFSRTRRALPLAVSLMLLAACSGEVPQPPPTAATAEAAAPAVAPITDEAGLRAAAAKALTEQRFYAPAGNSALDHYLALRDLRPDDANLATAMLELLPYAVIGIEQSVARQELDEARRLLGLLERADPQAPSLSRLRDSIASAEASAESAAAEALAQAARDEAARLAAEKDALAQAATATTAAEAARSTPRPAPVAIAPAASSPPAAARVTPPPAATPTTAAPSASVAAAPAPAATPSTSAAGVPRLLSAPSPRYPLMAQRRKLEGQVVVQFTIQPDGSVASPRVVSADPPGVFEEAALVAASRWRFETGPRSVDSSRVVQFRLAATP